METQTTAQILRAAREKIAVPQRWTQGVQALTANSQHCFVGSVKAVCWCSGGAILAVAPNPSLANAAADALRKIIGPYLVLWNDAPNRTHLEVLAAFDAAIAAEERV